MTMFQTNQSRALAAILPFLGIAFLAPAMAEDTASASPHKFAIRGASEVYTRGPMQSEFLLTAEDTEGRYSIVDEIFSPGFDSEPGHAHHYHSEVFYVVRGQMEWTVNGEVRLLGPGDLVYIPPRAPHFGKVVGDEDVHALMIYEPAGYEKNYLARRALTPEQRRDPEVIRELQRRADVVPNRPPE